jgi:nucleoside-diphosphate-sugar epimerase
LDIDAVIKYMVLQCPEYVVHLGARTDLDGDGLEAYQVNIEGVRNMVAALNEVPSVKKVIFASSRLVCKLGYVPKDDDDYFPTTAYGESKVEGERIVKQSDISCSWCIVRPTSIWGPWFNIPYRTFFDTVRMGRYVHPKNFKISKSFGFVGNTVHQLEKLLFAPNPLTAGKVFYLADYAPLDVLQFARKIRILSGLSSTVFVLPLPLLKIMALFGDLLKVLGMSNPPLTSFRLDNLVTNMVFDMTQLSDIAGATLPCDLDLAIAKTIKWIDQYG